MKQQAVATNNNNNNNCHFGHPCLDGLDFCGLSYIHMYMCTSFIFLWVATVCTLYILFMYVNTPNICLPTNMAIFLNVFSHVLLPVHTVLHMVCTIVLCSYVNVHPSFFHGFTSVCTLYILFMYVNMPNTCLLTNGYLWMYSVMFDDWMELFTSMYCTTYMVFTAQGTKVDWLAHFYPD